MKYFTYRDFATTFHVRAFITSMLILTGLLPSSSPAQSCTSAPAGLVSWWQGEGNGTDQVSGNNGTASAGVSYVAGYIGSAFSFNGTRGTQVNVGNPTNLQLQNFSIDAWIQRGSTSQASPFAGGGCIFSYGGGGYGFGLGDTGALFLSVIGTSVVSSGPLITDLGWHHVVVTKTGSTVVFYVDGVSHPAAAYGPVFSFASAAAIGSRGDGANTFLGLIDEVDVFNRALTSPEMQAIYNAGTSGKCKQFPLVIATQPVNQSVVIGGTANFSVGAGGLAPLSYQWVFNSAPIAGAKAATFSVFGAQAGNGGNYAVIVSNSSGSLTSSVVTLSISPCVAPPSGVVGWWQAEGNAIDLQSGASGVLAAGFYTTTAGLSIGGVSFVPGMVGQAFGMDGSRGSGVALGSPGNLQLQDFTIEAWIKLGTQVAATNRMIFGWGGSGYAFMVLTNGALALSKLDVDMVASSVVVTAASFHHVAATKSGTAVVFYIDGVAYPVAGSYTSTFTFGSYGGAAIGARGDYFGDNFLGLLDEVTVYNRGLTSNEVQGIYTSGSAGKCGAYAPIISVPPANQVVSAGNTATLSVTAAGSATLFYQWQSNSVNISGATNSTFILPNAQPANSGNYSVIVSNAFGATPGGSGILTVVPPGCTPIPAGLVGWWPGGSDATDIAKADNGQLFGGVTFAPGEVGQAFNFTGSVGQAVVITNSVPFELQEFTVEAWIRLASPTAAADRVIFGFGPESYAFIVRPTGTIALSKVNETTIESTAAITDTLWHHVAVVRQAYSGVTLYIDGVAYPTPGIPLSFNYYYTQALGIGAMGSGLGNPFSGEIDEVSFYNRMLAPEEIQAIFFAGTIGKCDSILPFVATQPAAQTVLPGGTASFNVVGGGPGLLTYQWQFNNTVIPGATNTTLTIANAQAANVGNYLVTVSNFNGSTNSITVTLRVNLPGCTPVPSGLVSWWQAESNVVDAVGNANGQAVGAVNYGAGESGSAFIFNGNSAINLGNPAGLQLEIFTIEGWIQLASPTAATDRLILGYSTNGYAFGVQSNGTLFLGKVGVTNIPAPYVFTDTALHHVAVVRSVTALTFYVDGVAYPSPAMLDAFQFTTTATIGAKANITVYGPPIPEISTNYTSPFNGKIDELSVYNRALSTAEIQNIYVAGIFGKCPVITPQIVIQPVGETVLMGSNASFTVAANPGPLTYQWQFNGNNISGATTSALNVTNAQATNIGSYTVAIGNLNGSTNSLPAPLNLVSPGCAPAPANLVSYWPGEGNFSDFVGGNGGVNISGNVTFAAGEVGQAMVFNGAGVSLGSPASLQAQDFTIEAWIQPNTPLAYSDMAVLAFGAGGYIFGVRNSGALFLGKAAADNFISEDLDSVVSSSYVFSDTNFHHVAVTKSGSTVVFYVDGVPYTGPAYTDTFTFGATAWIGGRFDQQYFRGKIDELSFYNRPLATSEIQAIYVAGSNGKCVPIPPIITTAPASYVTLVGGAAAFSVSVYGGGPFAYQWKFNGDPINGATAATFAITNVQMNNAGAYSVTVTNAYGAANSASAALTVYPAAGPTPPSGLVGWWRAEGSAVDLVNTNNGTLHGGVSYATGEVGQAFKFDGTNGSAISLTNISALQLQNFTIEAWIQLASVSASGDRTIFGYGSSGYTFVVRANGALALSKVGTDIVVSPFTIADTSFHHVAVTKNGTVVVFYLDGVAYPAPSYTTTYSFSTSPAIGANGASGVFNGKLDEVSVYNRALIAIEIQSIYTAGSAGKSVVALTNPTLNITQTNGNVLLTWPVSPAGFNLESTTGMGASNWTTVALTPVTNLTTGNATVTLPPSGTRQYYRLHHP